MREAKLTAPYSSVVIFDTVIKQELLQSWVSPFKPEKPDLTSPVFEEELQIHQCVTQWCAAQPMSLERRVLSQAAAA